MRLNKHRILVIAIANLFQQLIENSRVNTSYNDLQIKRLLTFYFAMEDFLVISDVEEYPPAVECLFLIIKQLQDPRLIYTASHQSGARQWNFNPTQNLLFD